MKTDKRVWGAVLFTICIIGMVTFVAFHLSSPAHDKPSAVIAVVFFAIAIIAAVIQSVATVRREERRAKEHIKNTSSRITVSHGRY